MEKEPLILGQMLKLKLYYENGTISYEGEANSCGHLEGKGKFYNKKGELLFEGEFFDGIYWNGKGKLYYNSFEIFEISLVCAALEVERKIFLNEKKNENGKKNDAEKDESDENDENDMDNNQISILKCEGEFHNEKKNGKGKLYSKDGKTIFEGIFYKDKPFEGKKITYDKNGKIIGEMNILYGESNGPIG